MTNEFSAFTDTLTPEQKAKLLEALGVVPREEVPEYKVVTPKKKTPVPVKKKVVKKAPAKKAKVARAPAKKKATRTARVREDFTMHKSPPSGRKVVVKAKANEWQDTGECRTQKTKPPKKKLVPVERVRPEPVIKQLVCPICGRKFKIHENLIYGEFTRCTNCK